MDPIDAREAEIAKIAESKEDVTALRLHLKEIIEGAVFKGSHRSSQFLQYIVDQAIAGNFESLKERVIGVELFARSTSYDTGEDAIVRVTASDVRKRLLQHYGKYGASSAYRISLPLGSYIPEITRDHHFNHAGVVGLIDTRNETSAKRDDSAAGQRDSTLLPNQEPVTISLPVSPLEGTRTSSRGWRQWLSVGFVVVALNLALWGIFWIRSSRFELSPTSILPWSAIFRSPHFTYLIISDPNITEVQDLTGHQISVSDYANRNYIPDRSALTPEISRICQIILAGDNASAIDTPIAVQIATLARAVSGKFGVHSARDIKLADLKTDDNFVLLGSPRSNPWFSLFNDQLDFRFVFDKDSRQEIIRNFQPRPNELPLYVPTALGGATGQSFAIVALVQNMDQNGQVLLLAGANAEGTEAAANLVTNLPRISTTLQKCGISASGRLQHFELLLRLSTMAGSPNEVDVVACHILSGTSPQKL
jgi:hypothetical protein